MNRTLLLIVVVMTMIVSGVASVAAPGTANAGIQFSYTLKEPGSVSVAVYDGTGAMVRTLQYGQKLAPGTYTLSWDGLDRYGKPQPPGKYEWRLLRTPGFTREFLLDVGTNITWRLHDYWPGNHFGPSAALVDNEGKLYVGSASSEGPPTIVKLSQDGRKLDWTTGTWGFCLNGLFQMVRLDRYLYILMTDGTLQIYSTDKGAYPSDDALRSIMQRDPRGQFADLRIPQEKKAGPNMTLAAGKDFLAVSYKDFNAVRLLWPQDGKFARDETVAVPAPSAVTVAPDGRVFALSGNQIVMFREQDRKLSTLLTDPAILTPVRNADAEHQRLSNYVCLAYDPAFDDLLVGYGSGGQVRRYHAADGKLVAIYGRPEGRKYGAFNPLEFDGVLSIAPDGKGGFFTAELCPRRVAHFSGREKLKLKTQWFGGMAWEGQAIFDPADSTIAYVPIDYKHIGRAVIDYKARRWTLTHLYETPEEFGWGVNACDQHYGIFPNLTDGMAYARVHHVKGQTYLVYEHDKVMVIRIDLKADHLIPVAVLSNLHPSANRMWPPRWWIDALKRIGINADYTEGLGTLDPKSFTEAGGYTHFAYTWADTNRNGKFDLEEVSLGSVGAMSVNGYAFVDADWNIYTREGAGKAAWAVIPNESKDPNYPVWNWDHQRPGGGVFPEWLDARAFHVTNDGSVYALGSVLDSINWDVPPGYWPNNATTSNRFLKWDKQGRLLFATGFHSPEKSGAPGGFTDVRAFAGEVRGNIVVRDGGMHAMVWTPDGLYAGNIANRPAANYGTDNTRDTPNDGPWTDDCWNGQVLETAKGEVLWFANDTQNTMVLRVGGWDGWERQQGALSLNAAPACAQKQGDGLRVEYFNNPNLDGEPVLQRVDPTIWFGPLWGNFRQIDTVHPWRKEGEKQVFEPGNFSVRWTGFLEPQFTEKLSLIAFIYGSWNSKGGSKVRVWLDGKLVIDSWDGYDRSIVNGWYRTRTAAAAPIPLQAGQRVPIKIEYVAAGDKDAHLHLYWESASLEQRHVPQAALYSKPADGKD